MSTAAETNAAPHKALDEPRVRVLRMTGWLLLAMPALYLGLLFAVFPDHARRGIGPGFLLGLAVVALLLLRAGLALQAARLVVYAGWTGLAVAATIGGGIYAPQIVALPLAIVLAGWLLGPRHAVAVTALSILLGLGLAIATHLGRLSLPPPAPPILAWLSFALPAIIISLLTWYIVSTYEIRLAEVRRLGAELSQRVEEQVAEKTRLRLIADNVPALVCAYEGMVCRFANPGYAEFFGFTPESIVGMHLRDIIGATAFEHARPMVERVLAGKQVAYRGRRSSPAFGERFMEVKLVPDEPEPGKPRGFYGVFFDITEQEEAAEAIRTREAWLRLAGDSAQVGLWEWSIGTDRLTWNGGLKAIFGLPRDTQNLTLQRFLDAIHPEDLQETQRSFMAALEQRTEFDHEYRIVRPDGTVRWIVARGQGEYGSDGGPLRMAGAALDITERKHAEERFVKVFQASPVAISISRQRDGHYLEVNEAFVEQFGWARSEIIGRTSLDLGIWPGAADRALWIAEMRRLGRVKSCEATLNTKSGEQRSVLISAEQLTLEGDACIIGMVHDISERRRMEEALRDSEARLRDAQRIGHVGSWYLDVSSRRMTWSDELYRIYERGRDAFGGTWQDLLSMVHPDDLPSLREAWRASADATGGYEIRHRILTPDGRVKHLHVHWEVFRDSEGKPVRALGTAQDITDELQAKAEIQRLNEQLEARVRERTAELQAANRELESFAYSISHDLRAPLRGIDGFSKLLADEYRERLDAEGIDYLDRVRRAAQRMGTLIDDILELSRVTRQEMRRVRVDLSQLVAELIDERTRAEPEHRVEVVIVPDCRVLGDPQLLRVMMQNLLENAWKYSAREPAPKIEFGRETVEGEAVYFVRDNGVGFDMKYADRLFAPFQRLHKPEEFEGTGIGLATVARIVRRHGGRVWAESAPGRGTTIRITLPG